jgi:hypothetical protein
LWDGKGEPNLTHRYKEVLFFCAQNLQHSWKFVIFEPLMVMVLGKKALDFCEKLNGKSSLLATHSPFSLHVLWECDWCGGVDWWKQDQKVNWRGTPFEVRVDRALANQSDVSPRCSANFWWPSSFCWFPPVPENFMSTKILTQHEKVLILVIPSPWRLTPWGFQGLNFTFYIFQNWFLMGVLFCANRTLFGVNTNPLVRSSLEMR